MCFMCVYTGMHVSFLTLSSTSTNPLTHTHLHTPPFLPYCTQAHIIAAQNARAVEESLKALGASGDSGTDISCVHLCGCICGGRELMCSVCMC